MEEYDSRIPEKLQLLRVGLGGRDDLAVFAYYPSSQQTNFANPSFCLAPASDEPGTMDVHGAIEETLHDLLDHGATADDVRQVMGLVQEDELDETALEYNEYIPIDLGWCIDGQLLAFEKLDPEASDVRSFLSDEQIAHIEDWFDVLPDGECLAKAEQVAHDPTYKGGGTKVEGGTNMKAMLIPVDGELTAIDIHPDKTGSSLRDLQKLVGGNIDVFDAIFGEDISVYVNDEGLFTCPPNRAVYATREMAEAGYLSQVDYSRSVREGELYTILFGDLVAVGFDPETGYNRDLTDAEMQAVSRYFTEVSAPGSGLREAIAIRTGKHHDNPVQEERAGLKETADAARAAAGHLDAEPGHEAAERDSDAR